MPTKKKTSQPLDSDDTRGRIKKLGIVAMFSIDALFDELVLKGGNVLDLIYGVSTRASVDLDFSVAGTVDILGMKQKIEQSLQNTFAEVGYVVFDLEITRRPKKGLPPELLAFWGGYFIEFKVIAQAMADGFSGIDVHTAREHMRKQAINLGQGPKFTIDISLWEFVEGKANTTLDGYTIYVYTPLMVVCEKLRAICQQLPAYGKIIKRETMSPRPRDFVDIKKTVEHFGIDLTTEEAQQTLTEMFRVKRVPLAFLGDVHSSRDFHKQGFESVLVTIRPGVEIGTYDENFDYVLDLCGRLEPLWNV